MFGILRSTAVSPIFPVGRAEAVRCIASTAIVYAPKKKDPSIPVPPKQPATSYGLFFKDFFAKEKDNHIDPTTKKIILATLAKAASPVWTNLPSKDKDQYIQKANQLRREYDETYSKFYESLTKDQKKLFEITTGKKLHVPGKSLSFKKDLKERPGNPGKGVGSYLTFLEEIMDELKIEIQKTGVTGKELIGQIGKLGGERWKSLSEVEKAAYKKKSDDKKAAYSEWQKTL